MLWAGKTGKLLTLYWSSYRARGRFSNEMGVASAQCSCLNWTLLLIVSMPLLHRCNWDCGLHAITICPCFIILIGTDFVWFSSFLMCYCSEIGLRVTVAFRGIGKEVSPHSTEAIKIRKQVRKQMWAITRIIEQCEAKANCSLRRKHNRSEQTTFTLTEKHQRSGERRQA